MNSPGQFAMHIRQVYFGGNWTASCLRKQLEGSTVREATTKIDSLNTIVALAYHINYYALAIINVLEQRPLDAHDRYSFDHPPIQTKEQWEDMLAQLWNNADRLASLVEEFPEEKLGDTFADEKYGNYHRNFLGFLEHTHYHLGQIVLVKKLVNLSPV